MVQEGRVKEQEHIAKHVEDVISYYGIVNALKQA